MKNLLLPIWKLMVIAYAIFCDLISLIVFIVLTVWNFKIPSQCFYYDDYDVWEEAAAEIKEEKYRFYVYPSALHWAIYGKQERFYVGESLPEEKELKNP